MSHRTLIASVLMIVSMISMSIPVSVSAEGPSLEMVSPADGLVTNAGTIDVTGRTDGTIVTVNQNDADLSGGNFSYLLTLSEGPNAILVVAEDATGNWTATAITVMKDVTPPVLSITGPTSPLLTNHTTIHVKGHVERGSTVSVNGTPATVLGDTFSADVEIDENTTGIVVTAVDEAGNVRTETIDVTFDDQLSLTLPEELRRTTMTKAGLKTYWDWIIVNGTTDPDADLTINDVPVQVDKDGKFKVEVYIEIGWNTLYINATDDAGNLRSQEVRVKRLEWEPFVVPVELAGILLLIGLGVGTAGGIKLGRYKERKARASPPAKPSGPPKGPARPPKAPKPQAGAKGKEK